MNKTNLSIVMKVAQKIFLLFAIFYISATGAFAQDVIILKNGNDIQAVVSEIGTDEVKYKRFDNPDGPTYTLKKGEIFMIMYPNGSRDVFSEVSTPVSTPAPSAGESVKTDLTFRNGGYVWQNEKKLSPEQVRLLMAGNSEALNLYNSGRSLNIAAQVIIYPSAFFVGWDLIDFLFGDSDGTLLTVGAIGSTIGIIIGLTSDKKIKNSLLLYNSQASNNSVSYQVNFGFTQTGVGLSMRF